MTALVKENFKGICVGIISSVLFLYFFQPILDFIGTSILKVMSLTGSKWSNDFYSKIAHLELIDYSFYWISLVFGVLASITLGIAYGGIKEIIMPGNEDEHEEVLRNSEDKPARKRLLLITASVAFTFVTVMFLSTKYYQFRLISSFKQHLRVVSPYITEQEEEMLLSRWSLMKSSSDYESIYATLNDIAVSNSIVLPENKIYSLSTF